MIGIVGGMGPKAGLALHDKIIKYANAKTDQDYPSIVHISRSGEIADRTKFLNGELTLNPGFKIAEIINDLGMLGAKCIGIPCNTSHSSSIFDVISSEVNNHVLDTELVHMINETVDFIHYNYQEVKTVGVLSTNGTYHSSVFQDSLAGKGIQVLELPDEFQNEIIHRMIYDADFGIKANYQIRDEVLELLNQILCHFKNSKVDAIILGCTEFSLIPPHFFKGFNTIDTLDILAQTLLDKDRKLEKQELRVTIN